MVSARMPGQEASGDLSSPSPAIQRAGKGFPLLPGVERIRARKKLTVAQFRGESPLFFMLVPKGYFVPEAAAYPLPGGGRIAGTDIAIAKMIAKELGVDLEILRNYGTYEEVVGAVARGEADLGISDLTPTFARQQAVRFSKPYVSFSLALLCNREKLLKNDIRIEPRATFDDFLAAFNIPSLTIAVEGGTSLHEQAQEMFPQAKVVCYPNFKAALKDVREGKADVCLSNDFEFLFVKLFDPELGFYCSMLRIPDTTHPSCVALSPDSADLMGLVNEVVKYYTFGSAADTIRKYGRVLKNMERARREDPAFPRERSYPFDTGVFAEQQPEGAILWKGLSSSGIVALPLVVVMGLWSRMSKNKKRESHG